MQNKTFDPKAEYKLVEKAQKNKKYFGILYERYQPQIFGYIRKRIEKKEISEDLTSKVFEKALKGIDNYQWQGVPFSSWLFRIARNVLNDYYRLQGRKGRDISLEAVEYMVEGEEPLPDEQVIIDESEYNLYKTIAELDKDDQYLLYYKFFENLTNVEIAKITGLSETNVGTRLYRIRKKMKSFLKDLETVTG